MIKLMTATMTFSKKQKNMKESYNSSNTLLIFTQSMKRKRVNLAKSNSEMLTDEHRNTQLSRTEYSTFDCK